MKKILLAYSGGLDTSCILKWLEQKYAVPIVAYCADVGQNEDFSLVEEKALKTGATKCIIDNLKQDFVENYVFTSIKANMLYEGVYYMGTALARPCIAAGMVKAALQEGCDAIAHGATGKGNDQVRFELAIKKLAPHLKVIAPWREWQFNGRLELIEYAKQMGIDVVASVAKPYSVDANLMHVSYEGGVLEDPSHEPPSDIYTWTTDPELAPDIADYVTIEFDQGKPIAVNGKIMSAVPLLEEINALGAKHGIGRVDCVENRFVGIKSRGVYETPGATILMQAHRALESITVDREVAHLKDSLALKLAELTYYGFWFAPECELLKDLIEKTQSHVSGTAKIKLYKGSSLVVSRSAPKSLYSQSLSSFENTLQFNMADSTGFINLHGLRLATWSQSYESLAHSL